MGSGKYHVAESEYTNLKYNVVESETNIIRCYNFTKREAEAICDTLNNMPEYEDGVYYVTNLEYGNNAVRIIKNDTVFNGYGFRCGSTSRYTILERIGDIPKDFKIAD